MKEKSEKPLTVSVPIAARRVGICPQSYLSALRRGEVPGLQIGRRWVVPVAALERFLEGGRPESNSADR